MDAFFTISSPLPVEEPAVEDILVDSEGVNNQQHSGCVIA